MLESMRKGAANWFAKFLLSILTLSFAVWGIADMLRNWGSGGALATVGSIEIQPTDYQRRLQLTLDQLSNQYGRRFTPDQARMFGLDSRVLGQLIGGAALDNYATSLGMKLSDKTVIDLIQKDPNFAGADGKFDQSRFEGMIRQIGFTERGYIEERRHELQRQQLTRTIAGDVAPPEALVDLMHRYSDETRVVQYFVIDASKLQIPEPTDAELQATYEAGKTEFVIPEYRKVGALMLTLAEIKKQIPISDEAIKAEYDQNKQRYDIPEKRRVQQIPFKSHADAEAAAQAIASGKSFDDIAKAQNVKDTDMNLGLVTKSQMLDPKVADAAFALAKDKPSGAVDGRFASFILRVTDIDPGRTRSLDEVKDEIRNQLASDQANNELSKRHDDADDMRGAGKSLKEMAEQLKVPYVEVAEVDHDGKTPDGKPAFTGEDAARIVDAAFSNDPGAGGDAIESADTGYIYVDNLGVTPAKQQPFEAVQDKVKAAWAATARSKAASELAAKLVERADKNEAMDKLAAEAGGTLTMTKPFKRTDTTTGLPPPAVQRAFILSRGATASAETQGGATRLVMKLTNITPPEPLNKRQSDAVTEQLTQEMQQDAVGAFVTALQERAGVRVNEQVFKRVSGADQQQ